MLDQLKGHRQPWVLFKQARMTAYPWPHTVLRGASPCLQDALTDMATLLLGVSEGRLGLTLLSELVLLLLRLLRCYDQSYHDDYSSK